MPRFVYKAKKGPSEIVQGEVDAENEDAALGKISGWGLIPIKLQAAAAAGTVAASETGALPSAVRGQMRATFRDVNIFTRQFAILLKASVPLLRIFEILQTQSRSEKFKMVLRDVQDSLRQGGSLSETLGQYPRIFSQIYVSMVNAGEISGTLDKVLMRLAEFAEREAEVRARVRSAFVYPAFLFLMGILTIFVLLTFVMPRLMGLFSDLGTELPGVTLFIIAISKFLQANWIWIALAAAVIAVVTRSRGLSPGQKRVLDRAALGIPMIGALLQKAETSRFLRSLELLYEHGIPLYQAVDVARRTVTNIVMQEELAKVPERLEGGATLARSLEEVPYISPFVTHMVSVGEESGQLGAAVRETAAFYEAETNEFIKVVTSLLEPLMILIIGVAVGFIVIAMLLPIFEIHVLAQ
jgi:type II secretory pathway component PulF